ncbi:hypothetical protein ATANTOWER_029842 [Ataeniobius toweri]|uniref:Uncharacterized protein n=1 Tax=Ataeniobius toweri TaxID=208326 RepID=A0ABU7A3J7_9TELE|nr:hypothetical protein [Ataeniobius toweri]
MLLLTYQSTSALITYISSKCCFLRTFKSEFYPKSDLTRPRMDHTHQKCVKFYFLFFWGKEKRIKVGKKGAWQRTAAIFAITGLELLQQVVPVFSPAAGGDTQQLCVSMKYFIFIFILVKNNVKSVYLSRGDTTATLSLFCNKFLP